MSALAQAIASQLGNAGGGYATARDAQTEGKNNVEKTQFEQQMRMKEYAEQQKQQALSDQIQQARQKSSAAGNITTPQIVKGEDGKYYQTWYDLESGKTVRQPIEGTPESIVKEEDVTAAAEKRQQERQAETENLAKLRNNYAKDQIKLRAGLRGTGAGGNASTIPLAIKRWYGVLGGDLITQRIAVLDRKLSSDLFGVAPDHAADVAQLQALYAAHDKIMDDATKRAGSGDTKSKSADNNAAPAAPQADPLGIR